MAGGAYQLSMARATVTIGGEVVAKNATVTVRGTEGRAIDRGANVDLTMAVASLDRKRREATLTAEDGTTWVVRTGGCGCGR